MGESQDKLSKTATEKEATFGRNQEVCQKTRLTAAGNIKAGPGKLYWLIITNANSSIRHCTLHDATSGTTGEVAKFYTPAQRTVVYPFDPPIPFATGIRIGAIENSDTVITGGYI